MKAEQLTPVVTEHGEGPVFSARWIGPRWVDMLAGDICELSNSLDIARHHVGAVAALIRPRTGRGSVVVNESKVLLSENDDLDAPLHPIVDIINDQSVRMNEGNCDPAGNLIVGSMAYDQRPGVGKLYQICANGGVQVMLDGVTISNGLDWTPDGSQAFYVDTPTGSIDVFDWDADRGLTHRRPFARPPGPGSPDGLTVDAEGGVWVALFGGSAVHRYGPNGSLEAIVEVPVRQTTAVAFAGDNLDQLIITTSRYGLGGEAEPAAGALFTTRPGVKGVPVREFSG